MFASFLPLASCSYLSSSYTHALFSLFQGADVVRIVKPGKWISQSPAIDMLDRGKRTVELDLKDPEGLAAALRLIETADVLIEGKHINPL